jgi:hypothetical protein
MVTEELQALHTLPDWAVLVQLGNYLRRDVVPTDAFIPDNEMALLLTVLRLIWRGIAMRWEARRNADLQQEPYRDEPDGYEPSVPFDHEVGPCEPRPA